MANGVNGAGGATQAGGGGSADSSAQLAEMQQIFAQAQETALATTKLRIEEGSKLDIVKQRLPT